MSTRGFTLLEMCIAAAVLTTAVIAGAMLVRTGARAERLLWDDLVANELAVSVMEHALADERCELTPPSGTPISNSFFVERGSIHSSNALGALPKLQLVLYVSALADRQDLREVRVTAQWLSAEGHPNSIERRMRRTFQLHDAEGAKK